MKQTLLSLLAACLLMSSCHTVRESSNFQEDHRVEHLSELIDSLIHRQTVTQQDSAWRETFIRHFQSIREKSDTMRSVTLSATGDTLRERIVINNIRETTSSTDRQLLTVLSHRLQVMDSTVQQQNLQIIRMDSLLRQQSKTVEIPVEKPLSWLQQMQIWLGRLVLVALAVLAAWWLIRKKAWWLALLRKLV
jgi:hypothetical protein